MQTAPARARASRRLAVAARATGAWLDAMSDGAMRYTGGCLCGALRYEAEGPPGACGHCFGGDCRTASGSDLIPFMNFPAPAVRFTGEPLLHRSPNGRCGEAVRNCRPAWAPLPEGLTIFEAMPG